MRIQIRERHVLLGVAVVALASVGFALLSQHKFDMWPCPWCILQRLIYVVIALLAVVGAFAPAVLRRLAVVLALLAAGSGIASAMWQQLHAVNQLGCDRTLADRIVSGLGLDSLLPNVFQAWASCADAAVNLLGIPYGWWSCALFVALGAVLLWVLRFDLRRRA